MNNQIIPNQNRSMSLPWSWSRSTALWSLPSHYLKIKNVNIVEIVFTIPASKDVHFGAVYNISRMIKSTMRCTSSSRALVPSHSDWIKSMQIFKWLIVLTFASKDNDSWTCEKSCVTKSWSRWCSLHLGFDPSWTVQIEDMSVIEVDVSLSGATIVMTAKIEDRCSNQSGRVSSSSAWRYTLNLRKCPKPTSFGI